MVARFFRRTLPFLPDPAPLTPLVRLEGEIGRGGRFARGLSLAGVDTALERAFRTPDAAAVAIVVNSPGGSPVQSRMIHDRIRALAEENEVPVFVFCEDVAASGGYMLACAGDEVFADESSIIGSIGVVGAGFGAHGALEKLGLERRLFTAGKNKARLDPFRPVTDDDREFVAHIQGRIHESFIALVQQRRGLKLDDATELFEGDVWTGLDAMRLGLIDGIGEARAVLREKFGDKVRIKAITPARAPLLQRLLNGGADALARAVLDAVEARALWGRFGL